MHTTLLDVTEVDGETPLDWARDEGHTEVVDYLKSLPQSFSQSGEQSRMTGQCKFVGGLKYVHVLVNLRRACKVI